jgi:quercetin dioxygenase-like cupin family protein
MMERLSPPERAVFVLREAFDLPYREIAPIVQASPAGCRQPHHRARSTSCARYRADPSRPTSQETARMSITRSASVLTMLLEQQPPATPSPAEVMTVIVTLPPGDPGTPPHRHSGPVFGYMLDGEMTFELEGESERMIRAGEAFWEPGGDVIHYQAANHLSDAWSRFVVVMIGVPGQPMLTLVSSEELEQRRDRRAPRP